MVRQCDGEEEQHPGTAGKREQEGLDSGVATHGSPSPAHTTLPIPPRDPRLPCCLLLAPPHHFSRLAGDGCPEERSCSVSLRRQVPRGINETFPGMDRVISTPCKNRKRRLWKTLGVEEVVLEEKEEEVSKETSFVDHEP